MIKYEVGYWGLHFVCKIRGSVFPKAVAWAVPAALLTVLLHYLLEDLDMPRDGSNWVSVWANYNYVLGFLLVFRTQEAYRRYWEGGTLMQQVRGEWYNAASSLVAFCSSDPNHRADVEEFQHCLVRLVSMLYCAALQQVSEKRGGLQVLDYSGLNRDSIDFLASKTEKCEIILQWIQRLIVDGMKKGVIDIPPPILSRVFQELSRGIVNMNNARKITDFLFPFPYAQMITLMLMCSSIVTPWIVISLLEDWWWSVALSFLTTLTFWSVHYIAIELEMPFGDDLNDLPLKDMQQGLNESLWTLLDVQTQKPPVFRLQKRHRTFHTTSSTRLGDVMPEGVRYEEMQDPFADLIQPEGEEAEGLEKLSGPLVQDTKGRPVSKAASIPDRSLERCRSIKELEVASDTSLRLEGTQTFAESFCSTTDCSSKDSLPKRAPTKKCLATGCGILSDTESIDSFITDSPKDAHKKKRKLLINDPRHQEAPPPDVPPPDIPDYPRPPATCKVEVTEVRLPSAHKSTSATAASPGVALRGAQNWHRFMWSSPETGTSSKGR